MNGRRTRHDWLHFNAWRGGKRGHRWRRRRQGWRRPRCSCATKCGTQLRIAFNLSLHLDDDMCPSLIFHFPVRVATTYAIYRSVQRSWVTRSVDLCDAWSWFSSGWWAETQLPFSPVQVKNQVTTSRETVAKPIWTVSEGTVAGSALFQEIYVSQDLWANWACVQSRKKRRNRCSHARPIRGVMPSMKNFRAACLFFNWPLVSNLESANREPKVNRSPISVCESRTSCRATSAGDPCRRLQSVGGLC